MPKETRSPTAVLILFVGRVGQRPKQGPSRCIAGADQKKNRAAQMTTIAASNCGWRS